MQTQFSVLSSQTRTELTNSAFRGSNNSNEFFSCSTDSMDVSGWGSWVSVYSTRMQAASMLLGS